MPLACLGQQQCRCYGNAYYATRRKYVTPRKNWRNGIKNTSILVLEVAAVNNFERVGAVCSKNTKSQKEGRKIREEFLISLRIFDAYNTIIYGIYCMYDFDRSESFIL